MGAFEAPHLIVILVIVLVIFGPGKLPQLGKALGDGIRELKHASNDDYTRGSTALVVTPTTGATRTCPRCQALSPGSGRFCGACGEPLDPAATKPTAYGSVG
jgi:sec-independent protein translocase protein TatA